MLFFRPILDLKVLIDLNEQSLLPRSYCIRTLLWPTGPAQFPGSFLDWQSRQSLQITNHARHTMCLNIHCDGSAWQCNYVAFWVVLCWIVHAFFMPDRVNRLTCNRHTMDKWQWLLTYFYMISWGTPMWIMWVWFACFLTHCIPFLACTFLKFVKNEQFGWM